MLDTLSISSFEKLKSHYSEPQYTFLWVYDNRVIIRENRLDGEYLFYYRNEKDNLCRLLAQSSDFNVGLQEAERTWKPKNSFKSEVLPLSKQEVLEQIESVLAGQVKREKIAEIAQADFCYIYWDEGWRCFYPKKSELFEYHILKCSENSTEKNDAYLSYLMGDECKNARRPVDMTGMVQMAKQK